MSGTFRILAVGLLLSSALCVESPVIGILTQPIMAPITFISEPIITSASAFGAQIIPIQYNLPEHEIYTLMHKVNGIIFPGGFEKLCQNGQFGNYIKIMLKILKYAMRMNDQGIYFPILGVCQGFEILSILIAEDCSVLQNSPALNFAAPLQFKDRQARILFHANQYLLNYIEQNPSTVNFRAFGIFEETFNSSSKLMDFFNLVATAPDSQGKMSAAIYEGKKYPIYATLFHPELLVNGFLDPPILQRTIQKIEFNRGIYKFFTEEAKKNENEMSYEEMKERDFQNYESTRLFIPQNIGPPKDIILMD